MKRAVGFHAGLAGFATSLIAAILGLAVTVSAAAPTVRPWTPPGSDSITTWAAAARAGFRAQSVDSITPETIKPFTRVGGIAQRWFQSLGRARMEQAPMVEAALDSLGFDTEIARDPVLPGFVLLVVRNPYRVTSDAVALFFWFRGDRLQEQAMGLLGGHSPRIRVWWVGKADVPYEWGIVEKGRAQYGPWRFSLLRLTADGGMWRPWQYEGNGPVLGECTDVSWVDADQDGVPEVLAHSVVSDSLFSECRGCPTLLHQRLFASRGAGFEMVESQRLPTAYATFVAFVRLLIDKNRAGALRLVERPALVDDAFTQGWGSRRVAGTWSLEEASPPRWPDRMIFRFRDGRDEVRYMVTFVNKEGRILLSGWQRLGEPTSPGQKVMPGTPPKGSR